MSYKSDYDILREFINESLDTSEVRIDEKIGTATNISKTELATNFDPGNVYGGDTGAFGLPTALVKGLSQTLGADGLTGWVSGGVGKWWGDKGDDIKSRNDAIKLYKERQEYTEKYGEEAAEKKYGYRGKDEPKVYEPLKKSVNTLVKGIAAGEIEGPKTVDTPVEVAAVEALADANPEEVSKPLATSLNIWSIDLDASDDN